MSEKHEESFFALMPTEILYDQKLQATEKVLYCAISVLTNKHGYCFASNQHFADLFKVSTKSISRWVNALKKRGYISVKYKKVKGTNEIEERRITLNISVKKAKRGMDTDVPTYGHRCPKGMDTDVQDNKYNNILGFSSALKAEEKANNNKYNFGFDISAYENTENSDGFVDLEI